VIQSLERGGLTSNPAFSPDGERLASGSREAAGRAAVLILWNLTTAQKTRSMYHGGDFLGLRTVAFSSDGARLASAAFDEYVRLWDVRPGQEVPPAMAMLAPAGVLPSLGSVALATTGVPLRILEGHTDRIHSVSFSPDGTRLASGS